MQSTHDSGAIKLDDMVRGMVCRRGKKFKSIRYPAESSYATHPHKPQNNNQTVMNGISLISKPHIGIYILTL